ncbi:hypothetical protein [Chitinophaga sp.]|uniref:hypothetical protein n=1 Tax=Chitinophaga sp. TaxID=1869181 RepID=UPI002F9216B5
MNLFFLRPHNKDLKNGNPEYMRVVTNEAPHNTSEGSEFLDDAIRMGESLLYDNENENQGREE